MSALEIVDLDSVEILAVGGPVHGTGSAPAGDHWTSEQLREVADANRALAGELKPPATVGHANSDDPAVGWLENVRINEAGDKLLADVKHVPRKFAELVKAGAYRTRSVKLSRVTSQQTGRRFENVVTARGLAGVPRGLAARTDARTRTALKGAFWCSWLLHVPARLQALSVERCSLRFVRTD